MLPRQGAVVNGSGVRVPISIVRLGRNQDRTVAVGSDALDQCDERADEGTPVGGVHGQEGRGYGLHAEFGPTD
jgi:hypothetical protein